MRANRLGDALAGIRDRNIDAVSRAQGVDGDAPVRPVEFDGVGQQTEHHLAQQSRIGVEIFRSLRDLDIDPDARLLCGAFHAVRAVAQHIGQGDTARRQRRSGRSDFRYLEYLVDHRE